MDKTKVDYRQLLLEYSDPSSESYKKLHIIDTFLKEGNLLLDIGIGTGELIELEKNKFKEIFGIDIERDSIELCNRRFKNNGHVYILHADIQKLPELLPDKKFDCCTCLDVLEHIEEKEISNILDTIKHCLNDAGIFIFSGPGVFEKIRIFFGFSPTHLHSHSSYGWMKIIKSAGFETINVETVAFPFINNEYLRKRFHLFGMCTIIVAMKKPKGG